MATYVLVLKTMEETNIHVGRLGNVFLKRGLFLYIGSAKKALQKRVGRHLVKDKKLFWHIDYILNSRKVSIIEVWTKEADQECETACIIDNFTGAMVVRKGLGSSDCRCPAHFYFFGGDVSEIRNLLERNGFSVLR
ncbi:MAG: GIY-YIG nuclease family protein [Thermodesulfobacteriota bacterium]|nr:MAG: GIY-YIG nuclease family protein [Thermodesulfobacteriota bacterium]